MRIHLLKREKLCQLLSEHLEGMSLQEWVVSGLYYPAHVVVTLITEIK